MWTERFRIRPVSHCKEGCCRQPAGITLAGVKLKSPVRMHGAFLYTPFVIVILRGNQCISQSIYLLFYSLGSPDYLVPIWRELVGKTHWSGDLFPHRFPLLYSYYGIKSRKKKSPVISGTVTTVAKSIRGRIPTVNIVILRRESCQLVSAFLARVFHHRT